MSKSFRESFGDFVFERAFRVALDGAAIFDPERKLYSEKKENVFNKIMGLLGENAVLMHELESLTNMGAGIDTEYAYRQGLKDGIALFSELGLATIGKDSVSHTKEDSCLDAAV